MTDPASVASLALGGASLAIQVFEGVKKGYEYFELAAHMPEDCASFKLRLRIEYSRFLNWADVAGLSEEKYHTRFDNKYRANRTIIMAVLAEMNALLQTLQMDYKELKWVEIDSPEYFEGGHSNVVDPTECAHEGNGGLGRKTSQKKIKFTLTTERGEEQQGRGERANSREDISDIDVEVFPMFQSPNFPKELQRNTKGLNHIFKFGKRAKNVITHPKRLKWALKDRQKFHEALKKLKQLTDYLEQTVGDYKLELLTQSTRETYIAMLQLSDSVKEIKDLLSASQIVKMEEVEDGDTASVISQTTTLVDPTELRQTDVWSNKRLFEQLALFSIVHAEMFSSYNTTEEQGAKLDMPREFGRGNGGDRDRGLRTITSLSGGEVWIEWKEYEEVVVHVNRGIPTYDAAPIVATRVAQLAALLKRKDKPEEFRVPPCLGYFQDEENARFGYVFQMPEGTSDIAESRSLFELLHGHPPPVDERVKMAQNMAVSLFYLHAVKWLHKGLRSASIMFFGSGGGLDFAKPWMCGFEYARPDTWNLTSTRPPNDPAWAVYCHPAYQGKNPERFRKQFDIYSLGIILLEIALWQTADEILGFEDTEEDGKEGRSRESLQELKKIRDRILKDESAILQRVRFNMGERYQRAVRTCIDAFEGFRLENRGGDAEKVESAMVQQAYLRLVVEVLQGIVL